MKLMNEIESDYSGTVAEILVNNQEGVEYGQPLFEHQSDQRNHSAPSSISSVGLHRRLCAGRICSGI